MRAWYPTACRERDENELRGSAHYASAHVAMETQPTREAWASCIKIAALRSYFYLALSSNTFWSMDPAPNLLSEHLF